MKVTVDESLCDGHGLCVAACPEVFSLSDEDDLVTILLENPEESLREAIDQAVAGCPKTALALAG